MKLILCKQCNDVVRLMTNDIRFCKCKASAGVYIDNINAIFSGVHCIPLGIDNTTLSKAVHRRETIYYDNTFQAFIVHEYSETFKRVDNVETSKK